MSSIKPRVKGPFETNLDCIHCGLCLPRCPTYQILGSEADSPRGRIYLIRALENGRLGLEAGVIDHLGCCLGCRACETACPSGVRYELMLDRSKARIFAATSVPRLLSLALRQLLPYPRRLWWVAGLLRLYQRGGLQSLVRGSGILQRLWPSLAAAEQKLPRLPRPARLQENYAAHGTPRYRVGFLSGCIMPLFFPATHRAAIEVLRSSGCEVLVPSSQTCCGALHSHSGDRETALRLAQTNLRAFPWRELHAIVVDAAGCGAALKGYEHLFADSGQPVHEVRGFAAKVRDICEFLDEIGVPSSLSSLPIRVAYDDACHLIHGQGVSRQPRRLLQRIPEMTLLNVPNSDRCCGGAGIYNVLRPQMADQLLDRKVDEILSVSPDCVATGNPGCVLQIRYGLQRRGIPIPVRHPVELLYAAINGGGAQTSTQIS